MRLKKIKLAGFKSFVDPTTVPFDVALSAVVGPNGCGKSNIIDAVRWVLGESSAKNLRGDAMTDVIFNGSSARKPVSQASVELVFDNTDERVTGELAAYNEISVKRQVNRDAQSTYFLNNTKCRRRDITDLFLGTGLGPRSYAIIEQGMISRLIESRPQELRIFIEEAAGISKYKERRRETENRLRHTNDNMERLADVRQELAAQLDKLQRQADAAQRYKTLKAEERKFKAELTVLRWQALQQQLTYLGDTLEQQQQHVSSVDTQQQRLESEQLAKQSELDAQLHQQQQQQQQLYQLGTQITRLEQELHHAGQRRQQLQTELTTIDTQLLEASEFIAEQGEQAEQLTAQQFDVSEQHSMAEERLIELEEACADAEQQLEQWHEQAQQLSQQQTASQAQYQQQQRDIERCQQQLTRLEQQQSQLHERCQQLQLAEQQQQQTELRDQIAQTEAQLEQLQTERLEEQQRCEHAQDAHQQHRDHVLTLQSALQHLEQRLTTIDKWLAQQEKAGPEAWQQNPDITSLAQLVAVTPRWTKAVDMVLQGKGRGFVAAKAHGYLPEPGTVIYEPQLPADVAADTLAAQVEAPAGLRGMLAHIYCADDVAAAHQRLAELPLTASIVTPDGHWLGHGWHLQQGEQPGQLVLLAEQQQLHQQLAEQQQQLASAEQLTAEAAEQVTACQQRLQQHDQQYSASQTQLHQQQQQLTRLTERIELAHQQQQEWQQALASLAEEQQNIIADRELMQEQLLELELQLEQIAEQREQQQQRQEADQRQLSERRAQREQARQQLQQLAIEQHRLQTEAHAAEQAQQRAQQQYQQLQQRQQQLHEERTQLSAPDEQWREDLEALLAQRLELEAQQTATAESIAALQEQLQQLQQQLKELLQQRQGQQSQVESLRLEQESLKTRAQALLEQLAEQNVKLKDIIAAMPKEAASDEWQQQLERRSRAISRLGPINLAAIEEFASQNERKVYLDNQAEDLQAAVETLENAIRRIDRECRNRFKETFDKVNNDLQQLFPKVFGGGSAYLALTDDDLLETGVTIMARPPGKRNATIQLLSGGEKALTALSLVFAIFRLNPAPFCMLDEVDAPLDDANVGRFCNLVREMSSSVQFIYISHNKVTMEMAQQLMGVTMHEPGVSRLVSVDVEQALALAEAS